MLADALSTVTAINRRTPGITVGLLAALLFSSSALLAGIQVASPPDRPKADYRTTANTTEPATLLVITYFGGAKAFVADEKVVAEFKRLIASADGHRASYCFCVNYPQVAFLTKDGPLVTVQVAHGRKFRFSGTGCSGDFEVEPQLAGKFVKLAMAQQPDAIKKSKGLGSLDLPKPPPPVVEK